MTLDATVPTSVPATVPVTDAVADDSDGLRREVTAKRPQFPPTWPVLALPRRQRAALFRAVPTLQRRLASVGASLQGLPLAAAAPISDEAPEAEQGPTPAAADQQVMAAMVEALADYDDLLADVTELMLVPLAADKAVMAAWADSAERGQITAAFSWLVRHDVGEALRSTGS